MAGWKSPVSVVNGAMPDQNKKEWSMPDIRYVCLSDMHFGAATSLFTNLKTASTDIDATSPSPVLQELVKCLRHIISFNETKDLKPTLVLNGDILELALCEDNYAAMTFERFIDLIMPDGEEMFDRIIYNPGNHDHHLWETARETQYVEFLTSSPQAQWGEEFEPPWHTTNIFKFDKPLASYFLSNLIRRRPNLNKMIVETAYPNFGILGKDGKKAAIFSHGHLTEDMYILMSTLKTMLFPDKKIPEMIWDLEAENFAWIDFFWSTLGRSEEVGKGVGCIYEKLQDEKQLKILLNNLAHALAKRFDIIPWGDELEAKMFTLVFNAVCDTIKGLERNNPDGVLSEKSEKSLWRYMEVPLRKQIENELHGLMPPKVTFIYGHTHKPFEQDMNFNGYPEWVDVYNSGGWVVDSVKRQPLHGGAVILIDEDLNAASLRMYNEADNPADYKVWVSEAAHPGDAPGPLFSRIHPLVDPKQAPWKDFSDSVARAVNVRAQDLRARINKPSY